MTRSAVETVRFTRVFPGQADKVRQVRREVSRHLSAHRCPVTDDVTLIVSEFAANAILHSRSNGQSFIVRTELFPTYVWMEVEDLGGPWVLGPCDPGRPHGLDVVEALAGPDNWGVDGDQAGHTVWCRLDLKAQQDAGHHTFTGETPAAPDAGIRTGWTRRGTL